MPTLPVFLPSAISSTSSWRVELGGAVEAAVGEHNDLRDLLGAREQPAGQRHGLADAGRSVARRDRVERLAQGALVVGQPAGDPRLRPRHDDRQLVAQSQAVDQPCGPRPWPPRAGWAAHRWRSCSPSCPRPAPAAAPAPAAIGRSGRPGRRPEAPGRPVARAARASAAAAARATAASSPRRSAPRIAGSRPGIRRSRILRM